MDVVVAPVFHKSVPVVPVADNTDGTLQLLETDTDGADGVVRGDALPVPALLMHPLTEAVTV
jgi:hypothetical protein